MNFKGVFILLMQLIWGVLIFQGQKMKHKLIYKNDLEVFFLGYPDIFGSDLKIFFENVSSEGKKKY